MQSIPQVKDAVFKQGNVEDDIKEAEEILAKDKNYAERLEEIEINWILLALIIAFGIVFAFLMLKIIRIAVFLVGAACGLTLGDEFYDFVLSKLINIETEIAKQV